MVESDGLENRYRRKPVRGSNPLLSAIIITHPLNLAEKIILGFLKNLLT